MPHYSTMLPTCKCVKLGPCFCGPFTILKLIGSFAYYLDLPTSIEVHLIFHFGCLKYLLVFVKRIACGSNRKPNSENAGLMESLDTQYAGETESKHKLHSK